jgi:thiamine transport system permease protein
MTTPAPARPSLPAPPPGRVVPAARAADPGPAAPSRRELALGRLGTATAWALLAGLPVLFLAVFFIWPVLTILAKGLVTDGSLDLSGFQEVFARPRTWRIIGLTLGQAGLGTALAVLLGVPGAYVLYRCSFPGRRVVRGLVTVPFVLPTVVVGVAFRSLLVEGGPLGALGLDGTLAAIVAALVFFNYSVVVRTVGGLWSHLDERPTEAARSLGAPPWRAFLAVTLPALTPAIASAAAIVFLYCAAAFGIVLVLGGPRFGTIETEIYVQTTQYLDLRAAAVLSVTQLVVVTVALRVAAVTRGRRERALRLTSERDGAHPLRAGDVPAAALTVVVVVVLLLGPMVALAVRSLRTADGWGLGNYAALAGTGSGNALVVPVWEALGNSLRVAVDATLVAVLIGGAVSVVLSRRPRRAAVRGALTTLDHVVMLPLGVSAVTVGFGFLLTLSRPPLDLRASAALVPIAQAVVAVPLVIRTVLPVLRAIDERQREAAAVLGAAPLRVFRAVDLPVLGRSAGLAVGFAFAVSLGEFGATSFLARPEAPTLPVVIYRLIGRPGAENFGMALAASVVLALVTTAVVLAAERLRVAAASEL